MLRWGWAVPDVLLWFLHYCEKLRWFMVSLLDDVPVKIHAPLYEFFTGESKSLFANCDVPICRLTRLWFDLDWPVSSKEFLRIDGMVFTKVRRYEKWTRLFLWIDGITKMMVDFEIEVFEVTDMFGTMTKTDTLRWGRVPWTQGCYRVPLVLSVAVTFGWL